MLLKSPSVTAKKALALWSHDAAWAWPTLKGGVSWILCSREVNDAATSVAFGGLGVWGLGVGGRCNGVRVRWWGFIGVGVNGVTTSVV